MDQWMKRYRIFSRTMLLISITQMLWVTWWSMHFAETSTLNGMEVAGVIADAMGDVVEYALCRDQHAQRYGSRWRYRRCYG